MRLSGAARIAGVMGWPIAHSRSPLLHGYWLERYGLDGAYVPLAVRPEDAFDAIRALPKLGFAGANVTVPHKEIALRAADSVEPLAERIGAVNTLVVDAAGRIEGRNTDAPGFLRNLAAGAPGFDARRGPALVIGAGGSARAVVAALSDAGAPDIRIVNRTHERAAALAAAFAPQARAVAWERRDTDLAEATLLVNATTQGLRGQAPLDLSLAALPPEAVVTDLVYDPLETPLLAAARARGLVAVDGLGMLLHQAVPGFAAWFGRTPEVTDELRALLVADIERRSRS